MTPAQVAAQSQQERSRGRVVAEVRRFGSWVQAQPRRVIRRRRTATIVAEYIHSTVRRLRLHPTPHRRALRPSTPASWLRRLADGLPAVRKVQRSSTLRQLLAGYRALAPAASASIERGNAERWREAARLTDRQVATTARTTTLRAALWLTIRLQLTGLRPMTAVRATLRHSRRERIRRNGKELWEVRTWLDKHNPTGAMTAWQRRWLPVDATSRRVMTHLPLPSTAAAVRSLVDARRELLAKVGIRQTYSARRTVAEKAEQEGLDPAQVLAHRPGSKSTPGYTNTTTATALLERLRPL